MASLIAARFAVVTTLGVSIVPIEHNLRKYGLAERCARVRAAEVPVLALEERNTDALGKISAEITAAIRDDRAEAIVLGCAGMNDEMGTIVVHSLADYPAWQAGAALRAMGQQLLHVATGEGASVWLGHTWGIIERYIPAQVAQMRAARQQNWGLDFDYVNWLHVPVALVSMLALVALLAHAGAAGLDLRLAALTQARLRRLSERRCRVSARA